MEKIKNILYLMTLISFFIHLFGCSENSLEPINNKLLKGTISSQGSFAEYYHSNNLLSRSFVSINNEYYWETIFKYDSNDKLIRSNTEKNIFGTVEKFYKLFYYNENDLIIKIEYLSPIDDSHLDYYYTLEYDNRNNLIRYNQHNSNHDIVSHTIYSHINDKMISEITYLDDGEVQYTDLYEYDDKVNPYPNLEGSSSSTYLSKHNLIKSTRTFTTDTYINDKLYEYDNLGNPSKCTSITNRVVDQQIVNTDTIMISYEYY